MKEVSQVFRDRPMSPLDSAVWWTEYVVRNQGALHLESPVATLPTWQYLLLDVAAAAALVAALAVLVAYSAVRYLIRAIATPSPKKDLNKKRN